MKGQKSPNADVLQNLVVDMNKSKKFAKGAVYALQCIQKMATDEVAVEEILQSGAINAAMGIMSNNAMDDDVLVQINGLVCSTAVNAETTATLCKQMQGKMGGFVKSLSAPVTEDTLVSSCKTMAALTKDPNGRAELVEEGGIEALAKCIKDHPQNKDMIRSGALALSNISKDPRYAKRLMDAGAMQLILDAMKRFPDDPELMEAAAAMIANLSKNPEMVAQLKAMGAIDALVEALERHPFNETILECAQDALSHLAGESEIQNALGTITMGVAGKRPDKKTSKALATVAALCLVDDNVAWMHSHSGVESIVSAIKGATPDSSEVGAGVVTNGARTLQRLCVDPKSSYAVMQAGGVRSIVAALQANPRSVGVAEASISALAAVMDRKEHALYVGKVGGVEGMLTAVREHPADVNVAKAAVKFIKGMAQYPEGSSVLAEKGGVVALVNLLRSHMAHPEVTKASLEAVLVVAETEQGRKALVAAGAIPLLVKAIVEHPDNADVIKAALRAMAKMIEDPAAIDALKKAGAVDAITAALDNFPGDPELQALGQKVLRALAGAGEIKASQEKAVQKRVEKEESEEEKKKKIADAMEDELSKNMQKWELEMKKRKEGEADRLRAYEELKRREGEVMSAENARMKEELERRAVLEAQQKAIREQQEMIQRIKQEKIERFRRKDEAKREAFQREAWKKYEHRLQEKPDDVRLASREKVRQLFNGEQQKEESDEEDDTF
jgi:hypothetical protein